MCPVSSCVAIRDDRDSTIESLQREIAEMQNTVLYYENRILRKRIAIEEIVQSKVCGLTVEPVLRGEAPKEPSVRQLAQPLIDQGVSDYYELKKRLVAMYPGRSHSIKRGLWQACQGLIEKGMTITMPPSRLQYAYEHPNGSAMRSAVAPPVEELRRASDTGMEPVSGPDGDGLCPAPVNQRDHLHESPEQPGPDADQRNSAGH